MSRKDNVRSDPEKRAKPYTAEEDAVILSLMETQSVAEIARRIGRSSAGVYFRIKALTGNGKPSQSKHYNFYAEEEERLIADNYGKVSVAEIARMLGRDSKAVSAKICCMKKKGRLPDLSLRNKFHPKHRNRKTTEPNTETTMDLGKKIWNSLTADEKEWVTANSEIASVTTATTKLNLTEDGYKALLEYRGLKGRKETPSLPKEKEVAIAEASSNLPDSIVDNPEPKPYPIPENEDYIIAGGLTAESVLNAICNEELIAEAKKRKIFSLSLFTDEEIAAEFKSRGLFHLTHIKTEDLASELRERGYKGRLQKVKEIEI